MITTRLILLSKCTCLKFNPSGSGSKNLNFFRSFTTSNLNQSSSSSTSSNNSKELTIKSIKLPTDQEVDSLLSPVTKSIPESIIIESPNKNNNKLSSSTSSSTSSTSTSTSITNNRSRSKSDVKKDSRFFGFLRSKPTNKDGLENEKRNLEAERVLERTLRGGGKGVQGSVGGLNMRCTTLNKKGDITSAKGDYEKITLCSKYGIQPRDLRKLDSAIPTVVPTILVRKAAILFTILHLRVVITANEVSLFDSVGSEDSWLKGVFLWHLEHALKMTPKAAHGLPYEFRALESCLISVTTALETEWVNIRALVVELIDGLEDHIERDKLRLLLQYSRKLSTFQKRATLVQECLEEVLQNDDDLAAMYLTAKIEGNPRDSSEHEEIELLLESFSKHVEEIVSEVDNLAANVRHTEDIVELILDANRNSLLGLDLKVSICTLGLTSGALIAGLFGMNLTTKLELHPFAFSFITFFAFSFAGIVTAVGLRRLRRMRRIGLGGGSGGGEKGLQERLGGSWRENVHRRGRSRRD